MQFIEELESERRTIEVVEPLIWKIKDCVNISDEKFYNILISVTEAVNNAIVHGNKYDKNKKVRFGITVNENEIIIFVQDYGEGFNPSGVDDPRNPENILRESGRGVFLIKELCDSVEFGDSGRIVTMHFRY